MHGDGGCDGGVKIWGGFEDDCHLSVHVGLGEGAFGLPALHEEADLDVVCGDEQQGDTWWKMEGYEEQNFVTFVNRLMDE